MLHRLGYLDRGHLVDAMRNDLVGEYVGHTAPQTKQVLERAMGGVLFIDEAYYLLPARTTGLRPGGDRHAAPGHGERPDKIVVILAGYKDRMDQFFPLQSRDALADRSPSRLRRLCAGRAAVHRAVMLDQSATPLRRSGGGAARLPDSAGCRSRGSPTRAASATRWTVPGSGTRTGCRRPAPELDPDDLMRIEPTDILAGNVSGDKIRKPRSTPGNDRPSGSICSCWIWICWR